VGIGIIDIHGPRQKIGLQITQKTASSYMSASEETAAKTPLPGYYYMDLMARFQINESVTISNSAENVFDRKIQFRKNQPSDGRFYVVSAAGNF